MSKVCKEMVPTRSHGSDKVIRRSSHQDVKDTPRTHTKVTKDTKVTKETRVSTERLPSGAEVTDRYSLQAVVVKEKRTEVSKGRTPSGDEFTATVEVRLRPRTEVVETKTRVTKGYLPSASKPAITSGAKVAKPAAKKK